jgi:hypothetical protein
LNIQGNKNLVATKLSGDIRIDDQPKNPVANNLNGDTTTDDQPKNPFHRAECGGNGFKQVKL